jgi:hypothetical protein
MDGCSKGNPGAAGSGVRDSMESWIIGFAQHWLLLFD